MFCCFISLCDFRKCHTSLCRLYALYACTFHIEHSTSSAASERTNQEPKHSIVHRARRASSHNYFSYFPFYAFATFLALFLIILFYIIFSLLLLLLTGCCCCCFCLFVWAFYVWVSSLLASSNRTHSIRFHSFPALIICFLFLVLRCVFTTQRAESLLCMWFLFVSKICVPFGLSETREKRTDR